MLGDIDRKTIKLIQKEYLISNDPWFLGYSGGKDSSTLLKLVFLSLLSLKIKPRPITVIYCDTGVEIPIVRHLVIATLNGIASEAENYELPIQTKIVTPKIENKYFVKVIGRGYPPPSNKFRWCTDRLRINPVKHALAQTQDSKSVLLLGIRRGESSERDRTLKRHQTGIAHYFRQVNNQNTLIFSPIINYSVKNIWSTLRAGSIPKSIVGNRLAMLYWQASGECPLMHDPKGTPCGKGRFGCWTCTVVRKDHAVENLIREGYDELLPLFDFRNWLMSIRDMRTYRCRTRRNGTKGLGPFTLAARREILKRLIKAQDLSGLQLISKEEISIIHKLWRKDRALSSYVE
jgi:DNA sulfur modification protein DndC